MHIGHTLHSKAKMRQNDYTNYWAVLNKTNGLYTITARGHRCKKGHNYHIQ